MTETDELDVLRELRPPATDPDPVVVSRERVALMTLISGTEATAETTADDVVPNSSRSTTSSGSFGSSVSSGSSDASGKAPARPAGSVAELSFGRRRLAWRVGLGAALVGTAAAACWAAVVRRDPSLTTQIECADIGTIEAQTGNPVADCAAAWRAENGTEPPPLVAYTDESGTNVYVLGADQEPPDGLMPLQDDFRQEVRIRELSDELADVGRGLASRCFTHSEAVDLVNEQLARLGLDDWSVRTAPPGFAEPAAGAEVCATYLHYIDDESSREVVIQAVGEGEPRGLQPERQLARTLYDRMVAGPDHQCMAIDQALTVARDEAEALGFHLDSPEIELETIPASSPVGPICTRPTTQVGGLVHITLREAPASPDSADEW